MRRKVRIFKRNIPIWIILLLLIASGIGAAVGTILSGKVTGEVPVTVSQALLVCTPSFPEMPSGVTRQTFRLTPYQPDRYIGVAGDDNASFRAGAEVDTGDVFLIQLPLKNASNQDMTAELTLTIPDCIEVEVFGSDEESGSAVDHTTNVTRIGYNKWNFCLSHEAEMDTTDWRDSIGIVVGVDDNCMPGFYMLDATVQQIAGSCTLCDEGEGGTQSLPVLALSKTGVAQASLDEQVNYTIVVQNIGGSAAATQVVLKDTIPSGMSYISSSPTASVSGNLATWNVGTLAIGDSDTVTLRLRADQVGTWINRVNATCAEGSSAQASYTTTVTSILAVPTVSIDKVGSAQGTLGNNVTYTITVNNTGNTNLTNVNVNDQIPGGMSYVNSSPTGSVAGKQVSWSLGTMVPGEQTQMSLTLKCDTVGSWTDSATVTCTQGVTDTDSATTVVGGSPLVSIDKVGPANANQGTNVTYTITVNNTGNTNLTNVNVNDQIPGGMSYVGSNPTGSVVGKQVSWSLGTMVPGEQTQISLTLKADSAGTWTDSATVTCIQGVTDTDSATTTVAIPAGGMTMYTEDTVDPVLCGHQTTYNIYVTNQGDVALHNVRIVDQIPDEMSYVSATGPAAHTVSGRTVTFSTVASISAHQTLTYSITVQANTSGSALNVATLTYDEFSLPRTSEEGTTVP